MDKCLKCGEVVYTINWRFPSVTKGFFMKDGDLIHNVIDDESECTGNVEYACPACNAVLFTDYDDVMLFLKGELADENGGVESRSEINEFSSASVTR